MNFADQVNDATLNMKGLMMDQVKAALQIMSNRIIDQSPVDTGKFRNNWIGSINVPVTTKKDTVDKSGNRAKASVATSLEKLKPGDTWYLRNNQPYGVRLEYEGWSRQAPNGFLRLNVARTARELSAGFTTLKSRA